VKRDTRQWVRLRWRLGENLPAPARRDHLAVGSAHSRRLEERKEAEEQTVVPVAVLVPEREHADEALLEGGPA
jgi:hypothetical protein